MHIFRLHICILCLYCDMFPCSNVQKALYLSHTACGAAPLFTLCLKPEPSLFWLASWSALLWLVNRSEMSRPLADHVQCVGEPADRNVVWLRSDVSMSRKIYKGLQGRHLRQGGREWERNSTLWLQPLQIIYRQKTYKTHTSKREYPKKHNRAPLRVLFQADYTLKMFCTFIFNLLLHMLKVG